MDRKSLKTKIAIEASHTYFGGGFVLLDQILDYCENNALCVKVYVGYKDVHAEFAKRKYEHIILKKTNSISTLYRYCWNRQHILFFCNLPPFVQNLGSVLYAHNILFFKTPTVDRNQSLMFNFKKYVYFGWIKYFSKNVNVVACQTNDVKDSLFKYLNINAELYPFFKTLNPIATSKEYDFCYISSAPQHKNHNKLFQAVDQLSKEYSFNLAVTIADTAANKELITQIDAINKRHTRTVIINKGSIVEKQVLMLYSKSKTLVFPSLAETIALPLIEAMQCGLTVLSSDRPYSYQVIENPIVFDPLDIKSINQVMEDNLLGKHKGINQKIKVESKLPELIELLQK